MILVVIEKLKKETKEFGEAFFDYKRIVDKKIDKQIQYTALTEEQVEQFRTRPTDLIATLA